VTAHHEPDHRFGIHAVCMSAALTLLLLSLLLSMLLTMLLLQVPAV
jgi:hypothetical protein